MSTTSPPGALMTIGEVAAVLRCSIRHVHRLKDSGRMPAPTRLGGLVRWNHATLVNWISEGCPHCRQGGRKS